jgi:hypothetical protein
VPELDAGSEPLATPFEVGLLEQPTTKAKPAMRVMFLSRIDTSLRCIIFRTGMTRPRRLP